MSTSSSVSSSDLLPPPSAASSEPAANKCVLNGACDWFKTKQCAGPALVCLATALIAGYALPLFAAAVITVVGVASSFVLKTKYSVLNDVDEKITHQDIARHVGSVAVAFFAPSLALYALAFNLFQFGNVVGRQFIKA